MARILDEAFQRVTRASEHLSELETELLRFERPEFVELGAALRKEDPRTKEEIDQVFANAGFGAATAFSNTPPKIRILVGEVAYNLVAALDYLVFILAIVDSGSEQEGTQFPVCAKLEIFQRGRSSMLKGVSDEHVALIEKLQPYSGCIWTKALKNLSNLDKHRQLIQVRVDPLRFIGFDQPLAELADFQSISTALKDRIFANTMKAYVGSSSIVTLNDGVPIVHVLEMLKSQVTDVLVQFESSIN